MLFQSWANSFELWEEEKHGVRVRTCFRSRPAWSANTCRYDLRMTVPRVNQVTCSVNPSVSKCEELLRVCCGVYTWQESRLSGNLEGVEKNGATQSPSGRGRLLCLTRGWPSTVDPQRTSYQPHCHPKTCVNSSGWLPKMGTLSSIRTLWVVNR